MKLTFTHCLPGESVKVLILTVVGIVVAQAIKIASIYHLLSLDTSLGLVSISFLLVGYGLFSGNDSIINNKAEPDCNKAIQTLTAREQTIVKLIMKGHTNKEIAQLLSVEVSTVKTHLNNLYAKLQCKDRREVRVKFKV
jgi:RNA polymerase sigma factor (sigma-70 family)